MIAPKRFWTEVAVEPAEGGYSLRLDARPLRTPAQAPLVVPTRAFAEAIAAEWRAVKDEVRPEMLPFTRAANVVVDRVAPDPRPLAGLLAAWGETDLLCYRATEPEGLRRRQAVAWDPLLDWAAEALGAPLRTGSGVVHVLQPEASLTALRGHVESLDPFRLTALHDLVTLSGSLVLALAVERAALPAEDAWGLSRIDEEWQQEKWGEDAEAAEAAALRRSDFLRSARLLVMLAESEHGA